MGVDGEVVVAAVRCPFCFHFAVEDFVYCGVEFFLVGLGKRVYECSKLLFGSVLDYCFGFGFFEGFCDGLLFALYPFLVFLEDLLGVFVGFWQY